MNKEFKLFYIFKDPLGANDCKIGITGSPFVRLGVYQNSYSRNSHVACFDVVYYGPARAVNGLEKAVKIQFNWDIERDGRGASEWIANQSAQDIEAKIDSIIDGYQFKVFKSKAKEPITVDNLLDFMIAHHID
jgi:hypothetical protein